MKLGQRIFWRLPIGMKKEDKYQRAMSETRMVITENEVAMEGKYCYDISIKIQKGWQ